MSDIRTCAPAELATIVAAHPMNLTQLAAPFPPTDIEWRIGRSGLKNDKVWATCLAYLTNRAIMQRLDEVCGPEHWRNEIREWGIGTPGVLCGISIRVGAGDWVTKWDGAEQPETEAVKGGFSNAMKRAAVLWGIGRYLYDLPEAFATVGPEGKYYQPRGKARREGQEPTPAFRWSPPNLPNWALPGPLEADGEGH